MTHWQDDALCATTGVELFFPDNAGDNSGPAKKVCAACPVQMQCLKWILANDDGYGIAGGMTPNERKQLRLAVRA